MSLKGNNVHWLTARVMSHQAFNSSYNRIYFQPDGVVLKCYKWDREEMEPNEEVLEAIKEAITNTCVLGLDCTIQNKFMDGDTSSSPYIKLSGFKYSLTQLQKLYFSEHTTDSKGLDQEVVKMFPNREEDLNLVCSLFSKTKL